MSRKYRTILIIWDKVNNAHGNTVSEAVRMQMTLDLYNLDWPNDPADMSDLIDALEYGVD